MIPATEIAKKHLGRPLTNAVMLGGAAALTGLVRLSSVTQAIQNRFHGKVGEGNVAAAVAAYEMVSSMKEEAK